ncbi:hypothetical protein EVAR_16465_1 [Eumeta japonica]|uniref:Uncharacterized protein n=1 Tax=Eumeta variegata TaxID=151549 RepID=A0A4C1UK94_EUMVA|nr:hypothetical protein EVAR_16465_1 [Eumeta japonica]
MNTHNPRGVTIEVNAAGDFRTYIPNEELRENLTFQSTTALERHKVRECAGPSIKVRISTLQKRELMIFPVERLTLNFLGVGDDSLFQDGLLPYRLTPKCNQLFYANSCTIAVSGGARRRRRRRPPTASRLKGPRKQKSFAYKLLKRDLANLMSPTSTGGVAPPLIAVKTMKIYCFVQEISLENKIQ